jgi:hypothetical protein
MMNEFALFGLDDGVDVFVEQIDQCAAVRHGVAFVVAQLDEARVDKLFEFRHNSIGLIQVAKHDKTLPLGRHRQRRRDARRRTLMLLLRRRMLRIVVVVVRQCAASQTSQWIRYTKKSDSFLFRSKQNMHTPQAVP